MLIGQIESDLTNAMKSHQEIEISVLRMLKSAIKNWQIANQKDPGDTDVLTIIQKEIKTRKDAIEMFKQGNRNELAQKEEAEINILQKYLPEQLNEQAIREKVKEQIQKTNATNIQDIGKVMGPVMTELKGQADGSTVSRIVKEELTQN